MHISARFYLTSSEGSSRFLRKARDTYKRASAGHLPNQSKVQQFTSDGNLRQRILSASPTGDIHRQIWKNSLTLFTNNWLQRSLVSTFLASVITVL